MRWTASRLPDLTGRVAIVTGGNSGIGFQIVRALAGHGARVVLAVRNEAAGTRAARRVSGGPVEVAHLDLASMASVREFAGAWDGPLDLLVNNAGVMAPPRRLTTTDGFELQFGTNHLGHFVLTGLLLPALAESSHSPRVVTVSSIAHLRGDATVVDANAAGPYQPTQAYANSKLANVLFARQLHEELSGRGSPVTSAAAHPGVCATGLVGDRQGMGRNPIVRLAAPPVMRIVVQSARAGARAPLYAASEGEPGSYTGPRLLGETRGPIGPARLSSFATDSSLGRRLWRASEELTGLRYAWD